MSLSTVPIAPGEPADVALEAWRQPADQRRREVRWDDPAATLAAAAGRSGRELMEAIAAGEISPPPTALLLGFVPTAIDEGEVTMSLYPGEHQLNPLGAIHGGVIATLLDSAMGCAVQTTLPAGMGFATTDLHVRYFRPAFAGGSLLHAHGELVNRGRRTATASGRLVDEDGRLYAHATTTCQMFELAGPA